MKVKPPTTTKPVKPMPTALIGRTPIHPWLHVDQQGVIIGRVTADHRCELVTSQGGRLLADECPPGALTSRPARTRISSAAGRPCSRPRSRSASHSRC